MLKISIAVIPCLNCALIATSISIFVVTIITRFTYFIDTISTDWITWHTDWRSSCTLVTCVDCAPLASSLSTVVTLLSTFDDIVTAFRTTWSLTHCASATIATINYTTLFTAKFVTIITLLSCFPNRVSATCLFRANWGATNKAITIISDLHYTANAPFFVSIIALLITLLDSITTRSNRLTSYLITEIACIDLTIRAAGTVNVTALPRINHSIPASVYNLTWYLASIYVSETKAFWCHWRAVWDYCSAYWLAFWWG